MVWQSVFLYRHQAAPEVLLPWEMLLKLYPRPRMETGEWKITSGSSSLSNWAESEKSENPFVEMFLPCFAHFSHEPSWLCFHQFCCQLLGRAQGSKNVPYRNHKLTMLMQAWRGRGVGPWMGAFHMSVGIILVGTKRVINYHSLTYQTCCGIWMKMLETLEETGDRLSKAASEGIPTSQPVRECFLKGTWNDMHSWSFWLRNIWL